MAHKPTHWTDKASIGRLTLGGDSVEKTALVDASGNQITSFGGGTQYAEGAVAATITGTAMLWEDAADTLRAISAVKPLPVSLGANVVEDLPSAGGETSVLIAGVRNDAAAAKTSADGDFGNLALDSAGRVGIADLGGSVTTDSPDLGTTADAEAAAGNGSVVAILKRVRTLLNAGLPAALGANGGMKVDVVGTTIPAVVTLEAAYTLAQTDVAIVSATAPDRIVVTRLTVVLDESTTVGVGFRVGLGATTTPTTTGVVSSHPGMVPGGGITIGDGSGVLAIGAAGDDLRITSEVPTSGSLRVVVSYYLTT